MSDTKTRDQMVQLAASMYARGLTFGSSGNLSVKIDGGWLMTPTGSSMGTLDPARLSLLDDAGNLVSGDPPTKESVLHMAVYGERPKTGAVVHLHSTHSVAVSCLADIDPEDVLPPITAYYVMKVGKLPLLPYFAPGAPELAEAVRIAATKHQAVLLANHGPVVAGKSLTDAVYATEELEETAKLFLLLRGNETRFLTPAEVAALRK